MCALVWAWRLDDESYDSIREKILGSDPPLESRRALKIWYAFRMLKDRAHGDRDKAAKMLGISRKKLEGYLQKFNITEEDIRSRT